MMQNPRALRRHVRSAVALIGPGGLLALLTLAAAACGGSPSPGAAGSGGEASRSAAPADRQVILITGSTDGLGREVALRLARTGAHIIVHGRNGERGQAVVQEIEREGVGSASFYAADLASIAQVRELGEAILRDYDRLDVLVNNAGIWLTAPGAGREVSADGHELHFAVNYLSGFLLTHMLLPLLVEGAPSRIINVASVAQSPIDFGNVMLEHDYSGSRAYGQSKLAQILFTMDLARELEGTGVTVNALHPATLMNTNMVSATGRQPMSTVDEGADALMNLVTTPDLQGGQYFNGLQPTRAHEQAYDEQARTRLRALSRQLVGLD